MEPLFSAVICSQEMEIVQKEMFSPVVPVVTSEDVPQKSALGIKPSQFG
jgi:acyl-CoA reductase-like NAD-dependent aldehyde dehydrogenase